MINFLQQESLLIMKSLFALCSEDFLEILLTFVLQFELGVILSLMNN